jgi:hypothetical protein
MAYNLKGAFVITMTSNGTRIPMWLTAVQNVNNPEAEGPVVKSVSNRNEAMVYTREQAEALLPAVRACYPDAQIVPK